MFPIVPDNPQVNAILEIVGAQPGISVGDLHEALKKEAKIDISLQHVYRQVTRLIDAQVMVKAKGSLTLNLLWIAYLEFFAEKAKQAGQKRNADEQLPLKPNGRVKFSVNTLGDVQNLWNHLLVRLYSVAPEKFLFKYYSHAWWHVGPNALDASFYKKIKSKGVTCFWLYGNETPLDRWATSMHTDLYASRVAVPPPFPAEGYNLNVYGEYAVECILPPAISEALARIFSEETDVEKARTRCGEIWNLKAPYVVTVRRSAKQALELRKKVELEFLQRRGGN